MPEICYIDKVFSDDHLVIINAANLIIGEYQSAGYDLTLRQIYYQFIARDLFPESWIDGKFNAKNGLDPNTKNTLKNYKRLGGIISAGRDAGVIDWDAIVDRGRNVDKPSTWDHPRKILETCAQQFKIDMWAEQPTHVEVWVEKDSLSGVLAPACHALRVPLFACKGYTSQSEMWAAAHNRFRPVLHSGRDVVVIHLGDHDPSGIDMTRDIDERLNLYADAGSNLDVPDGIVVQRIALNMDQIDEYNPPPNPAKMTDSRFESYARQFGNESWELDALEPSVMDTLVRAAVAPHIDDAQWERDRAIETEHRHALGLIHDQYDNVIEFLSQE